MLKVIKKYWYIPVVIGILIWGWPKNGSYNTGKYIDTIDSLQSNIDSISIKQDSVDQRIDTIIVTIEKIQIQYEKDYSTIINNTTGENYRFFSEYITRNSSRLDSINNL